MISNFNPISFIEMAFGFLALLTPIIAILTIKGIKRFNHPIIITSLPLLAFLIYKSLFDKVELNWAFPLVFAAIFIADKTEIQLKKHALTSGLAISFVSLILILTHPFKLPPNLTDQLYAWGKASQEIKQITGNKPVFSTHYTTTAQLRYNLRSLKIHHLAERERYLHEEALKPPSIGDFIITEQRHLGEMPYKLEKKAEIQMSNFSLLIYEIMSR